MRNSLLIAFLIALMISGLVSISNVRVGKAQSGTNVSSGIITSNTTWAKASSPFILTEPVIVDNGAKLTIEAGTTVNLNDYSIQVNGILQAIGSNANNIIFVSDNPANEGIKFMSSSTNWNYQTDTGCIIENTVLNTVSVSINSASPTLNNNTFNAPIFTEDVAIFISDGSPSISNNIIKGDIKEQGTASPIINNNSIAGGIYDEGLVDDSPTIINNNITIGNSVGRDGINCGVNSAFISDNTISNCSRGIAAHSGNFIIQNNFIFNNSYGINIDGGQSFLVRNNTISDNSVGIEETDTSGSTTIIYNNVYSNSGYNFLLSNRATGNVNATYNWWGTNNIQTIKQTILDVTNPNYNYTPNDYGPVGTVSIEPFLTASNSQAMPNPTASIPTPAPTSTQSSSPTPSVPEFPSWTLLLLVTVMVATAGSLVYFRKHKQVMLDGYE